MTTSSTALHAPSPAEAPATPAKAVKPATTVTKAIAKAPAESAKKTPTKPAPAAKKPSVLSPAKAAAPEAAKDSKAKKPKLVRDSFTIPKDEYAVIETLKQRCATLAQPIKKSELLRAGLKVLAAMSDNTLRSAVQAVPSIKTGRPKAEAPTAAKVTQPKSPKPARK
ncbi:hypothetical protein [Acidovorax radicis]|uniref:hypothetical protein n=1 Tax=Acidovorax radicis TaxID=758826 RepID=UPI001CFA7F73|nr:hypothetical protein [Acidovorax radicis]UCV00841.1 hypothetical protein KI609_08915 [Acidovorax radicis]